MFHYRLFPTNLVILMVVAATHYSCTRESSRAESPTRVQSDPRTVRIVRASPPDGAPAWLNIRVQTTHAGNIPMLEATGIVFGIPDRQLAMNAASGRALHELSAWLKTPNIQGLEVMEKAVSKDKSWVAVRARVPLPPDWTPPNPLPESKLP